MTSLTPTYAVNKVCTKTITYTAMGASTDGVAFENPEYGLKTVQAYGTFGGTVTIQGSNDPLGISTPASAVWATLTADGTNALTFTAAGLKKIHENPRFIRAISGAGVSDVDIVIQCTEGG